MSLLEHLDELRRRVVKIAIALAIGVVVGTFLAAPVLRLLVSPLESENPPIALSPTGPTAIFFKVSAVIGLVIAMPVIVYQLFQFTRPGLKPNEQRYILIGTPFASLSFAAGVVFAATVLIPSSLPFLQGFLSDIVQQQYSLEQYISFVTSLLIWAGLVFETPLVMYFLSKLNIIQWMGFRKGRSAVIIGAAVVAAIITPTTDPFNMLLIMGPFLLLYEFGILLARFA